MHENHRWVTVVEVAKDLGIEIDNELMWQIGTAVRVEWQRRHGTLPIKALRPKTNAHGSHCFAVYPHDWRPVISRLLLAAVHNKARQGNLFNEGA